MYSYKTLVRQQRFNLIHRAAGCDVFSTQVQLNIIAGSLKPLDLINNDLTNNSTVYLNPN